MVIYAIFGALNKLIQLPNSISVILAFVFVQQVH